MTVYRTVRCIYSNRPNIGLVPVRDDAAFHLDAGQTPAIAFRDRRRESQCGADKWTG